MKLLERDGRLEEKVTLRQVVLNDGSLIINNVPYIEIITPTLDGEYTEYRLQGSVSLKLSAIVEYMRKKDIKEFDYKDYEKFSEINALLMKYKS